MAWTINESIEQVSAALPDPAFVKSEFDRNIIKQCQAISVPWALSDSEKAQYAVPEEQYPLLLSSAITILPKYWEKEDHKPTMLYGMLIEAIQGAHADFGQDAPHLIEFLRKEKSAAERHEMPRVAEQPTGRAAESEPKPASATFGKWGAPGMPPDEVDVAWLRVMGRHPDDDTPYVVLGVRDDMGCWSEAADWKGESFTDFIDGEITHWLPYLIPDRSIGAPVSVSTQPIADEIRKKAMEDAAHAAWAHFMDACKKRGVAPAASEHWLASKSIRQIMAEKEAASESTRQPGNRVWVAQFSTSNTENIALGNSAEEAMDALIRTWKKSMAHHGGDPSFIHAMREEIRITPFVPGAEGGSLASTDALWPKDSVRGDHSRFDAVWEAYDFASPMPGMQP